MITEDRVRDAALALAARNVEPTFVAIARKLREPQAWVATWMQKNPVVAAFVRDLAAQIKAEKEADQKAAKAARRAEFLQAEREAIEAGRYIPYREPQNLRRRLSEVDDHLHPFRHVRYH